MIVASLPRCGATKFCMDRSTETGLPFIGELNPMYIDSYGDENRKQVHHETAFQPNYNSNTFLTALAAPHNYIILVNVSPHLVVSVADCIMLRREMRDAMLSTANFFAKSRPYLTGDGILQHVYMMHHSWYGLSVFLSENNTSLIWYEDYYGLAGTRTDHLDRHKHARVIYKHIDKLCGHAATNTLFEKVKQRYA